MNVDLERPYNDVNCTALQMIQTGNFFPEQNLSNKKQFLKDCVAFVLGMGAFNQ